MGITIDGENFLVKFPGNLRNKNMKNVNMSYSNSPLCEYIGSQVYGILNIPVHDTYLGYKDGKQVVACRDFLDKNDHLQEFSELKVTMYPPIVNSSGEETDGLGTDLQETLSTIRNHPLLADISEELEYHFGEMFVVDALIGNSDRNNENWGIILDEFDQQYISPVYDNGNCFNNKWTDEKIEEVLNDPKAMITEAYNGRRCIFEDKGKRINPYHYLMKTEELICLEC